jgi:hypothetical protein
VLDGLNAVLEAVERDLAAVAPVDGACSSMQYRLLDAPASRVIGLRARVPLARLGRNVTMEEFAPCRLSSRR